MGSALRSLLAPVIAGLLGLTLACRSHPQPPTPEKPRAVRAAAAPSEASAFPDLPAFVPGNAEHGKALVAQFECNRCHAGTGLAAPKLERDCVGCHEQIATGKFPVAASKLEKWQPHVEPYRDVPSLSDIGGRLRPAFIVDYLLHPRDLRPGLAQTMPRLDIAPDQARDIATYLAAQNGAGGAVAALAVSADAGQVAHGKQLLTERGCVGCHQVSGAGVGAPPHVEGAPSPRTTQLAPDLRFARERSEPAALERWLLDPQQVKRDAVMPKLGLSPEDARDLAAFLSFGPLEAPEPKSPPARLPVLSRRVGFDEVNTQVFAVTCRHCHTNPDLADGDGGPGNSGGFGFKARKIDFSSYQGIMSGALDAQGQRVSLFSPTESGLPRLVAALVARQGEAAGQPSHDVRGMPLGLPALSPEQVQLVESWVAQGRPL
jgi:mono/diheme cytochrome c family protein